MGLICFRCMILTELALVGWWVGGRAAGAGGIGQCTCRSSESLNIRDDAARVESCRLPCVMGARAAGAGLQLRRPLPEIITLAFVVWRFSNDSLRWRVALHVGIERNAELRAFADENIPQGENACTRSFC